MKPLKALLALSMLAAFTGAATAQVSPFVTAQVEAASKPCIDLASASAGLAQAQAKAVATAALIPCYEALETLDAFERSNGAGMTAEEHNYFYYVGGNVIWITAAAETMKNDGNLNEAICLQVGAAEKVWGNVKVPQSSDVYLSMQNNVLRQMFLPACR